MTIFAIDRATGVWGRGPRHPIESDTPLVTPTKLCMGSSAPAGKDRIIGLAQFIECLSNEPSCGSAEYRRRLESFEHSSI